MTKPNAEELRARLREALRPTKTPKPSLKESAAEMKAVRETCIKVGIDYSKMLVEVCTELRRKKTP